MTSTEQGLKAWLEGLELPFRRIDALAGDVSHRRYYRVRLASGSSLIAAHYPRAVRATCSRFQTTTSLLGAGGVRVPRIIDADCRRGWMLLEDAGRISLQSLETRPWSELVPFLDEALAIISRIQELPREHVAHLNPPLDGPALHSEIDRAWDGLLDRPEVSGPRILRRRLREALNEVCRQLAEAPLVPCHRDFMARNLMLGDEDPALTVIDHQDLRLGPRCYDLASLLNDSLFPPPHVERVARAVLISNENELGLYRRCVVQRCIKAADTFVRFASAGSERHLRLVTPSLERAARQLERLPEGQPVSADLASNWRAWIPRAITRSTEN